MTQTFLVPPTYHGVFEDGFMLTQTIFHLHRGDPNASYFEHVVGPPCTPVESI